MTRLPRSRGRLLVCVLLPLTLAGCMAGPDYVRPTMPVPAQFTEGDTVWNRTQAPAADWSGAAWWQAWHDPVLDALQQRAQQANLSIATADAAWRQAQAAITQARGAARPQASVGVTQGRSENSVAAQGLDELADGRPRDTAQAQATLSWELDLWGRTRRAVEAQGAQAQASAEDLRAQCLSIAASVASTYLSLRQADAQLALLDEQVQANAALLQMTEAAHRLGAASPDDIVQARNNVDASTLAREATRAARAKALHALAVLTGQAPAGFTVEAIQGYVFAAPAPPTVLPADLLRRRPDVRAAEEQVRAANAQIGVARAAYFPSLGLSASGGYVGANVDDLFDAPLRTWSVGGQLLATLFDGGARRAQVAQAQAAYDGTVARYRQSVLTALQDTEDALSDYQHQERQALCARRMEDDRRASWQRRQQGLALGTSAKRDALVETLSLLDARQNALDTQATLSQDAVALYKAIGGGWTP